MIEMQNNMGSSINIIGAIDAMHNMDSDIFICFKEEIT